MPSKRERIIEAAVSMIGAALPGVKVERNADKPERIPVSGLVILRDGEPGEPEDVTLSPLTYFYAHRIAIEVAVLGNAGASREEKLDAILGAIGAAVAANRALGGLADFVEVSAPVTDDIEAEGARSARWAVIDLIVHFGTTDPLN
jgi:hypothetical protein